MIVILTPEMNVLNECRHINELMHTGNHILHIRKYGMNDDEIKTYIEGINNSFHKRLVLHSHFHLAAEMGIGRLHFKEEHRLRDLHKEYIGNYTLSTSVHIVDDFNALPAYWSYAFLSPVFPSISKQGYGRERNVLEQFKRKDNPSVQLIGLGGIDANNCLSVYKEGADGIAVLGALWQNVEPCKSLLQIMKSLI